MFAKIWYVKINGMVEGPYSLQQLRHHPRVTPETLARKAGEDSWQEIRYIFELRAVFEDAEPLIKPKGGEVRIEPQGEAVLDLNGEFPFSYIWIILLLLMLIFLLWQWGGA